MCTNDDQPSFTSLPIETIAEILLYTCSPPTVLAVSRTCSFLYRSLALNPEASFIWRRVRKTCKPVPLPDPGDGWRKSEADYAAFVFGGGVCEVCQKPTRAMYVSFSARIRLCGSWYCRKRYLNEFLVGIDCEILPLGGQFLWVLPVESMRCFYPSRLGASIWPNGETFVRKRDWVKLQGRIQAHEDAERARAKRERPATPATVGEEGQERERVLEGDRGIRKLPQIMEVSKRLLCWKWDYDEVYKIVKTENDEWTRNLAESEGWNLADLAASQAYGSLKRRKTFLLENLKSSDVSPIRSTIESELRTLQERHRRQKAEVNYKERLTEVKKMYEHMRCGTLRIAKTGASSESDHWILPPLSVFCALPSIRTLKGSPDPSPSVFLPGGTWFLEGIRSPLVMSLIEADLHNWRMPIEKHLMTLLGYPNGWQSTSTRTLPPLKRVTARFFCRRCGEGKVSKGYQRERCLDFKGVCSHICVAPRGKGIDGRQYALEEVDIDSGDGRDKGERGGKRKSGDKTSDWRVDVFEKDEKAISLIKTILDLTGLSEESPNVKDELEKLRGAIHCMTCKGWIVMDFDTAIGHAHRHESMQIRLIPDSDLCGIWPSLKRVRGPNQRTCYPSQIDWRQLGFERGNSELLLGPTYRGRRLCKEVNYACKHCLDVVESIILIVEEFRVIDFNALRSHVKAKHGIQEIGDEDFFCIQKDVRGR